VALCRGDDREDRVFVRDLPSGNDRGQVPVRVTHPQFLCVAPDASWVATAGGQKPNNRRVRVWDVATGRERFAFDLVSSVTCLSASPDGRRLAVGVFDMGKESANLIAVFDVTTGERSFELPTRRKPITTLVYSADGKHLAAGFNGAVQMWDVPGRKLVRTLEGFERTVTRLAFDTNSKLLSAGMGDGQVWVWATATGRRTQVIETGTRGVRSLAFSPDGKLLVTATNKAPVAVWEVAPEPENGSEPDA
jgi:WD40 repeat protein